MRDEYVTSWVAVIVVLCVGTVAVAARSGAEAAEFVGPYLQNPTLTGVTVCAAGREVSVVEVEFGGVGATARKRLGARATRIPDTAWTVWKARLDGLKPGCEYAYRVDYQQADGKHSTKVLRFRTLNAGTVKAAVFNDTHERFSTVEALMKHCKPDDYDFSVLLGDCWQDPRSADRAVATLGRYVTMLDAGQKPMVLVRGNHEYRGGFAGRLGYLFDLPNLRPDAPVGQQKYYFTLAAGGVCFLAMDCGEDFEKRMDMMQPYRKGQAQWLKATVAGDRYTRARWRVKLCHIPLYNDTLWTSEPSHVLWAATLSGARIDVALSGHDHRYKVLEKGKALKVTHKSDKGATPVTVERTPPYPLVIGGGPGAKQGTVMLLKADADTLEVRMIRATDGRVVGKVNLGGK